MRLLRSDSDIIYHVLLGYDRAQGRTRHCTMTHHCRVTKKSSFPSLPIRLSSQQNQRCNHHPHHRTQGRLLSGHQVCHNLVHRGVSVHAVCISVTPRAVNSAIIFQDLELVALIAILVSMFTYRCNSSRIERRLVI